MTLGVADQRVSPDSKPGLLSRLLPDGGGAVACGITPPPPSGSNLLSNPGFELGDTLWSSTPNVIDQWGAYEPTHSGTWNAWLGGYGSTHDDSISQLVTIPSSSSATLTYYVHIDTAEAPNSPVYDTMTV